jgi:PIN domain
MTKKKRKPFRILVDTCVWLDLARDYREQPVIAALEDLVKGGAVELIMPQIVLDEFERNKARVAEQTRRSLHSHFQLVREAVNRFGDDASKADTIKALGEVDHAIVIKGDAVNDSIKRIEALLKSSSPLPATDIIKQRVTERAIASKAPYHRDKNNVADAIIIQTYGELLADRLARFRIRKSRRVQD